MELNLYTLFALLNVHIDINCLSQYMLEIYYILD